MDSYGNPTTEKLTVSDYNPIKFNFFNSELPFKYKISIHNNFRASRKLLPSSPNPHNHYLIQTKSSKDSPRREKIPSIRPRAAGLDASALSDI
ncbi:MAG: hypothetical protein ACLVIY_11025 [Anaerobutyricum soehngenii]